MNRFNHWAMPEIKHGIPTKYGWTVWQPEKFTLGKYTDIGVLTQIFCDAEVVIEDNVQIGGATLIYSNNTIDGTRGKVVIKEGARIGAQTIIFPGVTIGRNALVGAQSLVKSDVADNALVYGTPARSRKIKNA